MMHSKDAISELRVRLTIDSDMPELLSRLGPFKRPAREVLHLLRLGIEYERVMGRQAQTPSTTGNVELVPGSAQLASGVVADSKATPKAEETGFVNTTPFDASYYSPPPR